MKILLVTLFTLLSVCVFSQTELGIGLVKIKFNDKTVLDFYRSPEDKSPVQTLQFFDDKSINSWNIRDLEKHKSWLNPEVLWLDYYAFVFRYVTIKDNWIKVIVNNKKGTELWLKKSEVTELKSWEVFLEDMFGIERSESQKIRVSPESNAEIINYEGSDCFQVKSMRGEWIEIFTAEYCDESYTNSTTKIQSGWIKWKEGNKLLIRYFITS